MHGAAPVPPPFYVQQRAWERAYVLSEDFAERLTPEGREACREVAGADPARLTWPEIGAVAHLYDAIVDRRV